MSYRGHEKERPGPGLSWLSCLRQHCAVQKEIITSTKNKSPLCGSHCPGDEAQPPHDSFPDALQSKPRKRNNHTPEIHPGSWSQSNSGEEVTGSLHCHTTSRVSLALPVWTNLHRKSGSPPPATVLQVTLKPPLVAALRKQLSPRSTPRVTSSADWRVACSRCSWAGHCGPWVTKYSSSSSSSF